MTHKLQNISRFMTQKLNLIGPSEGGTLHPDARAKLAQLRRSVGKSAGADPTIWDVTLDQLSESINTSEQRWESDGPSFEEQAVHDALSLYAVHQQSKSVPMHNPERPFGSAIGLYALHRHGNVEDSPIRRRMNSALSATNGQEMAAHLRSIVTQLRRDEISFDYVRLAKDLYRFNFEDEQSKVRLEWGRALYRSARQIESDNNE